MVKINTQLYASECGNGKGRIFLNMHAINLGCIFLHLEIELQDYKTISLGYFAVNLSGGQPQMYWWLCCSGVKKYLLPNTRSTHTVKNYFFPMTVHRVDPQ